MLKIAICDDEKEFCDSAERMLKLYMEEKTVPYQADVFNVPSELVDMTEKGTIYCYIQQYEEYRGVIPRKAKVITYRAVAGTGGCASDGSRASAPKPP